MARSETTKGIKGWSGWAYVPGIAFIVVGVLALLEAGLTSLIAGFYLGAILCVAGGFGIAGGVAGFGRRGAGLSIFLGLISLGLAIMIFYNPVLGAVSLVRLIGFWFILAGIFELAMASTPETGRAWLIFVGGLDLVIGGYLFLLHPAKAFVLLGYLVGISFLIRGIWSIVFAGEKRRLAGHGTRFPFRFRRFGRVQAAPGHGVVE